MGVEKFLQDRIVEKYGNLKRFADQNNMPYMTLKNILNRGISKAGFSNVVKICHCLGISTETLCAMENELSLQEPPALLAAHKEDPEEFTQEELLKIEDYKKLLMTARAKSKE